MCCTDIDGHRRGRDVDIERYGDFIRSRASSDETWIMHLNRTHLQLRPVWKPPKRL